MDEPAGHRIDIALDKTDRECRREVIAYSRWLERLTPLRWISVGGGVVLSAAAGITILWDSLPHGKVISAILAFGAAVATGLHAALKCDSHQSECRKLIQEYKSISVAIAECTDLDPVAKPQKRAEIMSRLAHTIETTTATPSAGCYRYADLAMKK